MHLPGLGMVCLRYLFLILLCLVALMASNFGYSATPRLDNLSLPVSFLNWHKARYVVGGAEWEQHEKWKYAEIDRFFENLKIKNGYDGNVNFSGYTFYYDKFLVGRGLRELACSNLIAYVNHASSVADEQFKNELIVIDAEVGRLLENDGLQLKQVLANRMVAYIFGAETSFYSDAAFDAAVDGGIKDALEYWARDVVKDKIEKTPETWDFISKNVTKLVKSALKGKREFAKANKIKFGVWLDALIIAYVETSKVVVSGVGLWELYKSKKKRKAALQKLDKLVKYQQNGCNNWLITNQEDNEMASVIEKYGVLHVAGKGEAMLTMTPNLGCVGDDCLSVMFGNYTVGGNAYFGRIPYSDYSSSIRMYCRDGDGGCNKNYDQKYVIVASSKDGIRKVEYGLALKRPGHLSGVLPIEYKAYATVYSELGDVLNLYSETFKQEIDLCLASGMSRDMIAGLALSQSEKDKLVNATDDWFAEWGGVKDCNAKYARLTPEQVSSLLGRLGANCKQLLGSSYEKGFKSLRVDESKSGVAIRDANDYDNVVDGACFFWGQRANYVDKSGSDYLLKYVGEKEYTLNNALTVNRLVYLYMLGKIKQKIQ